MSSIDRVQASKNLPEGFISKPIRLVARKDDFETLNKMKLGERSDYILKHAQVLPRPKPKKSKKRSRVNLSLTDKEMELLDKHRGKASRAEFVYANLQTHLLPSLRLYEQLTTQDAKQKAISKIERTS